MRCAGSLLIGILLAAAVVGCKNQTAPLANPFLTPDRVPPPQTRVLMPGTAQPYYPGDPAPTLSATPAGAPATALPPTATTFAPAATTIGPPQPGAIVPGQVVPSNIPGGAYPGAPPVSPVTPVTPISPPGGWGTYPASGGTASLSVPSGFRTASTGGEAVRVPGDAGSLRFEPPTPAPSLPADAVVPAASQSIAALNPNQPSVTAGPGGLFQPNAGAQAPVEQARFGLPGFQQLATREVTQADFQQPVLPATASTGVAAGGDGFRPAGSSPPGDDGGAQSFRTPEIGRAANASKSTDARFGVGGSQEWLRGQLEYWPESGEWSIRYMGDGPKDQIGGRVLIENPQVLGNLPPGEFVVLHGQVFGRQVDESSYRPVYRVATVERQQK